MATSTPAKKRYRTNNDGRPLGAYLRPIFGSSVGGKAVVAVTAVLLTGFVIVHLLGNLLIFSGPDAINAYAHFLKAEPAVLWTARLVLLAAFVLHLTIALRLNVKNAEARPTRYVYEQTVQATLASRTMVQTGIVVGLFVLFHLAHYTFGNVTQAVVAEGTPVLEKGKVRPAVADEKVPYLNLMQKYREGPDPTSPSLYRHDVFTMVRAGFSNPYVVTIYVLAQLALLFHLWHGIASMLQSLGLNNDRFGPYARRLGRTLAVLITAGNLVIVLAVFLGYVSASGGH
jgi:succinate dehydrogenase / fumarate reductase cytochrome b subunit